VAFMVLFQILSTFAVLNVVIAIILSAFTWCYSLEQSELTSSLPITASDIRHFKAIWDRFDLYSTGKIDLQHMQLLLGVLEWNIPSLFISGIRNQADDVLVNDYASFGPGSNENDKDLKDTEEAALQRKSRIAYAKLVRKIGKFERSKELWYQLTMAKCDVLKGCNDNVAGFEPSLHPLGSIYDADLHIFTKEVNNEVIYVAKYDVAKTPPATTVNQVTFSTLLQILIMDPLLMTEHDNFVCFGYKDPFSYFQPGYFADKKPKHGEVCLYRDPSIIEAPQSLRASLEEADLDESTMSAIVKEGGMLYIETEEEDTEGQEIRYTTDGSTPTPCSALYGGPHKLEIKARLFSKSIPPRLAPLIVENIPPDPSNLSPNSVCSRSRLPDIPHQAAEEDQIRPIRGNRLSFMHKLSD